MIKYCSECGAKHEYKFSPPKFCSNCGAPMGVVLANESKSLNRNISSIKKSKAINDIETDAEFVPDISKLEYDIEDYTNGVQQTIGSLGGKSLPKKRNSNVKKLDDIL
tara:strand:- start:1381 stop:1704 length:324 start_codon:yes stop_codon:yes gene_type:complete